MDELTGERYGVIPFDEANTRPGPLVHPRPSGPDTPESCAARRRALVTALDGLVGRRT
jgi:hypothetical protein